jgi:hypothetical protein
VSHFFCFKKLLKIFVNLLRQFWALNVYIALCYYKLDYYDISQEVLAGYLQHFPDSAIGVNLKACNHYRLYNGKAAEVSFFGKSKYNKKKKELKEIIIYQKKY